MRRALAVRPEAELDIEEAAFWYDDQQPGLGDRFTAKLNQLLRRITEHPFQFPEIDHDVRRGLPQRFPYAVYFTVGEDTVTVIAVLHQHRQPDTWRLRVGDRH
jgi:plasmid stabilization system protein ParE